MINLTTQYLLRKKNILAEQLSRTDQVLPTEWSLLLWMFGTICREFGQPLIDIFATRADAKLSLFVSPVQDPATWKEEAFQHS